MQSFGFSTADEAISFLGNYHKNMKNKTYLQSIIEYNDKYYFTTDFITQSNFEITHRATNLLTRKDLFQADEKFKSKEVSIFCKKQILNETRQDCFYQRINSEQVDIFVSGEKISTKEMQELVDEKCFFLSSNNFIATQIEHSCQITKSKIVKFDLDKILKFMEDIDINHKTNWNGIDVTKIGIHFANSKISIESDKHSMSLVDIINKYQDEKSQSIFTIYR